MTERWDVCFQLRYLDVNIVKCSLCTTGEYIRVIAVSEGTFACRFDSLGFVGALVGALVPHGIREAYHSIPCHLLRAYDSTSYVYSPQSLQGGE